MINLIFILFVLPKGIYLLAKAKGKNPLYWTFFGLIGFLSGECLAYAILFGIEKFFSPFEKNFLWKNFSDFLLLGGLIGLEIVRQILLKISVSENLLPPLPPTFK